MCMYHYRLPVDIGAPIVYKYVIRMTSGVKGGRGVQSFRVRHMCGTEQVLQAEGESEYEKRGDTFSSDER